MNDTTVSLRAITAETVRAVTSLQVGEDQERFVATNAVSLAQALFSPEAWYRAVYVGDEPAGFVMLRDETLGATPSSNPKVSVWRFMIDAKFQGHGVGRAALELVIAGLRERQMFAVLELSYVPGLGCPEAFYRKLGFVPTGRVKGGEVEMSLPLD